MHQYTLKNPRKLGDHDPKYGQSYWSYTHESDTPIKFNLTQGDASDGQSINCEEYTVKKTVKGADYYQLRKVRIGGADAQQARPKREWQPRDDDRIVAQWSIGQAKDFVVATHGTKADLGMIESTAEYFFAMADRVKQSKNSEPEGTTDTQARFSDGSPIPDEVIEVDDKTPIDLNDIPF